LSGAPCVVHRLVTTCGEPLPDVANGAKAPRRHASLSIAGASRRSSGGAARRWKAPRVPVDPDPLRGESGEAALGPGWLSGLRKRTGLRPSRAGVSAPRKRRAGAVSGLPASRERAARGLHEPDALRVYVKSRARAAGSSETLRPSPPKGVGQRRAAPGSPAGAPVVSRREVSEWIGLGRSSVIGSRVRAGLQCHAILVMAAPHDARRRAALPRGP